MSQHGWLIECPHCIWARFATTQDAVNRAYTTHARTKHKGTTAPPPEPQQQLDLGDQTA